LYVSKFRNYSYVVKNILKEGINLTTLAIDPYVGLPNGKPMAQ
jgi:hypothetical protein